MNEQNNEVHEHEVHRLHDDGCPHHHDDDNDEDDTDLYEDPYYLCSGYPEEHLYNYE